MLYLEAHVKETILNFAPTGMIPTKKDTPYIPIEPREIITMNAIYTFFVSIIKVIDIYYFDLPSCPFDSLKIVDSISRFNI